MLHANNLNLGITFGNDAPEDISSKLKEAEELTEEVRQLLVQCEGPLNDEGVREEALVLERWLESYRRGISAARKLSNTAPHLLEDMSVRLRAAIAELQRYEEEGGNPATKPQQSQIEKLNRAMGAIHHLGDSLKEASFVDMKQPDAK